MTWLYTGFTVCRALRCVPEQTPLLSLEHTSLGDEMNPKRVYGSYTLMGIIVVRVYDPQF